MSEQKELDYTAIVMKLIGNVEPVGESRADEKSMENLRAMCELINNLVTHIDGVAYTNKGRSEHSIKIMVDYVDNFMTKTLGIVK